MIRRLLSLGVKAEVLQLTFVVGAIFGMVIEAVLITVPRLAFAVLGAVL